MIKQNSKQKKNSEFYESKITLHSSRTISKDLALRACTALKLKAIGIIRTFEFSKLGQKPFFDIRKISIFAKVDRAISEIFERFLNPKIKCNPNQKYPKISSKAPSQKRNRRNRKKRVHLKKKNQKISKSAQNARI